MPPFILPHHPAYLVAFSGGADSRLLLELTLRALLEREGEAGRSRVTAVHLHHGIRGEEADRDLAFCREVCARSGVELIFERVDIPALAAASGESIETAARRARYDLFGKVMTERGIPVLLTAHHADDNLETVLERLLRGSGTKGMGGIPPCRRMEGPAELPPGAVCRPLLRWTREEVLAACAELGLDYVTDSTNLETDCTRNRIRHAVIPALEAVAGKGVPQRAAARLSRSAREDEDYLWSVAEGEARQARTPDGVGVVLNRLNGVHPAIGKRMIQTVYDEALGRYAHRTPTASLSSAHLEALTELARRAVPESTLSLPCGMRALVRDGGLYFRAPEPLSVSEPPSEPIPLGEGRTLWDDRTAVTVELSPIPLDPLQGGDVFASAVFPAELPMPLLARRREAGDAILSHGMHKKLKKLLCDQDIPPHLRDRLPLICLPDGDPLWYPGAVFRDGYPAPASGPCVRVTVRRNSCQLPEI